MQRVRALSQMSPLLILFAVVLFPTVLNASEPQISFYALPTYFEQDEALVLEVWVEDPDFPGTPYPEFEGTTIEVSGFNWTGSTWDEAFQTFTVTAQAYLTEFAVVFDTQGPVKVVVESVGEVAELASFEAECVDAVEPQTYGNTFLVELDGDVIESGVTAGDWIEVDAQAASVNFADEEEEPVVLEYDGEVYVEYFSPVTDDYGAWEPTIESWGATDGWVQGELQLTSVVHMGMRIWVDPQDWAGAGMTGNAPYSEFWVRVHPGSPENFAITMGDMVAVEDAGYWLIEHLAHIVVMDEYGNHCTLDDETELEIELATNDTDLESAEGTPDFSRLPAPDPEGENGSEPDDETQLPRDLATPLVVPAKLRSRNNWHCLSATLSTTTLILPYQWNAYTNYHSSLGVPTTVQIIMSAPPSASSVIISAISATLTTQSGSLQLSPASPSILLQANQGIAKKNTIDAKLARTTANVGIYEDLGSWVRYGPAAVGQPHIHGGIVYGYSPLFAWTVPSELPHWGTPGTAHNTYRGNSRIGVVDFGNEIDHLIYSGARERVARAIRAEVTYDSTKLGQQGLQVTWDVSLEYHTYAYGYHSAVESGYSHSGGAVEMFVSANLAGKRIEASAGVDQNLSVQASSITVGVGPLSIPIPIPSTSGKSLDGSKATQQAPLIYSTTGQTTLFTVGAIAGQVHRAKSGGGYFQYETDHGLASHLINSRVEVTIQIGGNPSFVLGEVKFAP